MTSQRAGTSVPSMAVGLIENLPDPNAPDREYEETVAINTCAVSFIGKYTLSRR